MKFGSLFSGIGGFDLGFEQAGMECACQVEFNKYPSMALKEHWPDVQRYEDIKDVKGADLPRVDVLCGGFPCQDLSIAGKRAGLAGERSGLWWEFARIIGETNPNIVVIENVPGLLTSNDGRDMGVIVNQLEKFGYGWGYRILDSQYFGVAQRRRRVFLVGSLRGTRHCGEILFNERGLHRDTQESEKRAKENSLFPSESVVDFGRVADRIQVNARKSVTLQAHGGGMGAKTGLYYYTDKVGALTASDKKGVGRQYLADKKLIPVKIGFGHSGGKTVKENEKANTLNAQSGSDTTHMVQGVRDGWRVRKLTPTECERLQGFPDGWTSMLSDTRRYEALGNAVTVPVAKWIGERIVQRAVS